VSTWGRSSFGDPGRGCGYSWSIGLADAQALVARVPSRLGDLLVNAGGDERHPTLSWSVRAYVAHIGDTFASGLNGSPAPVPAGRSSSRPTTRTPSPGRAPTTGSACGERSGRFSGRAVTGLKPMTSAPPGLVMEHPERGAIQLTDIIRTNATTLRTTSGTSRERSQSHLRPAADPAFGDTPSSPGRNC